MISFVNNILKYHFLIKKKKKIIITKMEIDFSKTNEFFLNIIGVSTKLILLKRFKSILNNQNIKT